MAKKIELTVILLLFLSCLNSRSDTLWIFESSKSKSLEPNKKILESKEMRDLIERKNIKILYIDVSTNQSCVAIVKSLGVESVPAIFHLQKDGKVAFLAHVLTEEMLDSKISVESAEK